MDNIAVDILTQIINKKNIKAFNEFSTIELDGKLVVNEYTGSEVRVYNHEGKTHVLFPKNITPVQENALASAIKSGEIFDDAELVDRSTEFVKGTTLPMQGLANKQVNVPGGLDVLTKPVIGIMNDEGKVPCDQVNIDNGSQFVKDVCKTKETDSSVSDVVNDYLGTEEDEDGENNLPVEIGKSIYDVEKNMKDEEIDDESIDDDDIEEEIGEDIEEAAFNSITPDTSARLIHGLHSVNDVLNNPQFPGTTTVPDDQVQLVRDFKNDAETTVALMKQLTGTTQFDKGTLQLFTATRDTLEEMLTASDVLINPFVKMDDISDARVKNAVDKWPGDRDVLIKALPRLVGMIEDGIGKHIGEGFLSKKPKKLKTIPAREIVAYIATEMNAINDVNSQQMLAGYTCSKLEVADFYLSCIDNQDDRYVVPHTRDFIVRYQSDLNRLLTQILKIRPVNRNDRIWQINVNYPG